MNRVDLYVTLGRRGPHWLVLLHDNEAGCRTLLHCNPKYDVVIMDEGALARNYWFVLFRSSHRTAYSNAALKERARIFSQNRKFSVLHYNCIDFADELLWAKKAGGAKYKIAASLVGLGIVLYLCARLF